jgi:hypothetical protein
MTIRIRFRRPAPVAKKVCKHCENRRSLFRQEGILKWDPYYALCYKCYQRYFTHAQDELAPRIATGSAADRRRSARALETGLMPAR